MSRYYDLQLECCARPRSILLLGESLLCGKELAPAQKQGKTLTKGSHDALTCALTSAAKDIVFDLLPTVEQKACFHR